MSPKQFAMDDYIDVASRIAEFRAAHPGGSLQRLELDFREVNGGWWVIYTAAAYRSPDDLRPGVGTAWEPIPGRTPYTRDSEVQNAETAAWGRAIVASLAADTRRGVASAEEVRNAQARREAPPEPTGPPPSLADLLAQAENAGSSEELTRVARTAVAVLSVEDLAAVREVVVARRAELSGGES